MKLAIVHQLPLEYYPPVTNILSFLDSEGEMDVSVYSTRNQKHRAEYGNATAEIHRSAYALPSMSFFSRWWAAVRWHLDVAKRLAAWKPDVVLYYEPHSAFAVYWYFLRYRGAAKLFIHHHEYYEPSDYRATGNRMTRLNHFFEKRYLLNRAVWISQTNEKRLALFQQDHPWVKPNQLRLMPNYPPQKWSGEWLVASGEKVLKKVRGNLPIRLVYVGSVSLHDTFVEPLVEWVVGQPDMAVSLDIYAYNCDGATKDFLLRHCGDRVRFHNAGVEYDAIPELLRQFDVGVILYRCNTTNFKFNASNKLFEYLACGLEVWFPPQMLGVKPYARDDAFPRVMEVDFEKLDTVDLAKMRDTQGLPPAPPPPCCEDEFEKLVRVMRGG